MTPQEDPVLTPENSQIPRRSPMRFFVRGLAISLPPILTIVILVWLAGALNTYIISPASTVVRFAFANVIEKSVETRKLQLWEKLPPLEYCQNNYRVTPELKQRLEQQLREAASRADPQSPVTVGVKVEWVTSELDQVFVPFGQRAVPYLDYVEVASNTRAGEMPATSIGVYMDLVTTRYFQSVFHLSAVAVVITVVLLYFLGRVVTIKLGSWFVNKFETGVMARVPVVSNVYSSVKQVTDFFFTERTVSYNRVVAVEYPRKGIWSIGFVTSDGMREISEATGEPMLSLLMPTSPMPMTGFTVTVSRKDVIDLDITIDQAFQFCLSCGVLIPDHQRSGPEDVKKQIKGLIGDDSEEETASASSGNGREGEARS